LEWVFRGTTEGDLVVVLVRKMEATQLIGSAHSAPVTALEFSKHGRYPQEVAVELSL
jgi:hypothetical protein